MPTRTRADGYRAQVNERDRAGGMARTWFLRSAGRAEGVAALGIPRRGLVRFAGVVAHKNSGCGTG